MTLPSGDRVVTVRGPLQGQSRLCARILADLPEYFGLEDSNVAYARSADTLPSFVGAVDGRDAGLLLLAQTSDVAAASTSTRKLCGVNFGKSRTQNL